MSSSLARAEISQLLIVDIQTKLAAVMPGHDRQRVIKNSAILTQAASALNIPIVVSEQYPNGLGNTEPDISDLLPNSTSRHAKTVFSCCGEEKLLKEITRSGYRQTVIVGMESHVCVLQTALELLDQGQIPFVVADAVCARDPANTDIALNRLAQAGVIVTCAESVLLEWLKDALHPEFKALSQMIR